MEYSKAKHKNQLLFLPLGGSGEIGMNLNLYHFNGKWIIVDMGIGFASGQIPGVDIIVPETEFLQKIKDDLLAIVITHAHEDHLGAIPYLWEYFPLDIYTTNFNAEFLKAKLNYCDFKKRVKFSIQTQDKPFFIGDFKLNFIQLNHSVPEMNAILIEVDKKKIFHTADWKFDKNPVSGIIDDFDKLKQIGKSGINAMICDSTNVLSDGYSGSEGDLQQSLIKLINKQKNLTVISGFASNVGRIVSIVKSCVNANKKLVICGAAFDRIVTIAKNTGYIDKEVEILKPENIKQYKRNDLVILATGCQGEERAALRRIADNTYPNVKLQKGDTVIFSSKIIPGNDKKIMDLFNTLSMKEVNIITERDHFVHVSGHPNREELRLMYDFIQPRIAIPVHGEKYHLFEHCKFAKKLGVETVHNIANGYCIKINSNNIEKQFKVKSGYIAIDGNSLLPVDSNVIKYRRKLQNSGVVIISILLSKKA